MFVANGLATSAQDHKRELTASSTSNQTHAHVGHTVIDMRFAAESSYSSD